MKIYNTLTRKKDILPRGRGKPIRLFVCGPTVYDESHIGHARVYLFFDLFARYLKSRGIRLTYIVNITDIDDKIIARAKKEHARARTIASRYTREYLRDMLALGIRSVSGYPRATDFIPQIISVAQALISKGFAYRIEGDGYYFDIAKFRGYGKLSGRTVLQAEDAVSRIDTSRKKRNKGDFCLWKFSNRGPARTAAGLARTTNQPMLIGGEPSWRAPFGWGRPGWHIEDTAISYRYFGAQYELHGGGVDLKFPHHEAEIAQAEAASGRKPFVRIWMHAGLLFVGGKKMSKSEGNFVSIRKFLSRHSPNTLRLIVASHHYRSPINYSEQLALEANRALRSIWEFFAKLETVARSRNRAERPRLFKKASQALEHSFRNAMEDDVNAPEALASIFLFIGEVNPFVWKLSRGDALAASKQLSRLLDILGIEVKSARLPAKIAFLAMKRGLLRSHKQFIQADALRKRIERLGYRVEDTPLGPLVIKS